MGIERKGPRWGCGPCIKQRWIKLTLCMQNKLSAANKFYIYMQKEKAKNLLTPWVHNGQLRAIASEFTPFVLNLSITFFKFLNSIAFVVIIVTIVVCLITNNFVVSY